MERFHRANYSPIIVGDDLIYDVTQISAEGAKLLEDYEIATICDEIVGKPVFEDMQDQLFICKLYKKGNLNIPVYVLVTHLEKSKHKKDFDYQLLFYNAQDKDSFINPYEIAVSIDYYYNYQIERDGFLDFEYNAAGFDLYYEEYLPFEKFHDYWQKRFLPEEQ